MRSIAVSFLSVIAMTMICTAYAQLHNNNNQVLHITRNINSIEGQQPRRSRLVQHRRTRQLSKEDTIDNNDNDEQRQRKATGEASSTVTEEEEDLDQNMMVDKLVYYENAYLSPSVAEQTKEEELKTDRMVDGEATGYLDYTEVSSNHNSTGMLIGKSGKSNSTLISRKSKSGKGTKSNSINYDQVKDPIFGKARKGKSSKSSSSSSKGSKKSKLFGKAKDGSTQSPTTDSLSSTAKSWKGISSSEDGTTNKDTRVYDEEDLPYFTYYDKEEIDKLRARSTNNVSCSKSNPCQDTNTHFCKMSSGSCVSDEEEGFCAEFGSSFCKQTLEPICGCDGIVYSNSCQAKYLHGINVQCLLDSESTLQVGQSCGQSDCTLVDEEV